MGYLIESWLKDWCNRRKDFRKKVVRAKPMHKEGSEVTRPYRDPMPKGWDHKLEAARKQTQARIRSETGRLPKDGSKLLS